MKPIFIFIICFSCIIDEIFATSNYTNTLKLKAEKKEICIILKNKSVNSYNIQKKFGWCVIIPNLSFQIGTHIVFSNTVSGENARISKKAGTWHIINLLLNLNLSDFVLWEHLFEPVNYTIDYYGKYKLPPIISMSYKNHFRLKLKEKLNLYIKSSAEIDNFLKYGYDFNTGIGVEKFREYCNKWILREVIFTCGIRKETINLSHFKPAAYSDYIIFSVSYLYGEFGKTYKGAMTFKLSIDYYYNYRWEDKLLNRPDINKEGDSLSINFQALAF